MNLQNPLIKALVLLLLVLTTGACSTTRYVPEGKYLLTRVSISSDRAAVKTDDLQAFLPQRPNNKWFSIFNVPLGIYSLSGRDSTKRINRFIRHLGEAPVIYDRARTEQACTNMQLGVRNQGYLGAQVVQHEKVKGKRIRVEYRIMPHELYRVRHFEMEVSDDSLRGVLDSLAYRPRLSTSDSGIRLPFDVGELDAERSRLYSVLVENGYYKFNKEYIHFLADTTVGSHQVDVRMTVGKKPVVAPDSSDTSHRRYHIGTISHSFPVGKTFLRPKITEHVTALSSGQMYRESDIHETYARWARLSAVKTANVITTVNPLNENLLDVDIALMPDKLSSVSAELEGTNSAGDLGAAVALSYQNRNLFRGSELLNIKLRGAFEAIKGLKGYDDQNYIEYSFQAGLTFPDFKLPFLRSAFRREAQATTEVNFAYDSQDRPEFHRRVLTGALRYRWKSADRRFLHRFDLLDINYVFMPWISETFRARYLDDPQNRNAILKYNYENLFIMNWSYHFSYSSMPLGANASSYGTNAYTVRLSAETAGNLLFGITSAMDGKRNDMNHFTLFDIAYAQYAKADIDFCKSFLINKNNSFALHAALGIAFPYGNSNVLPYEKRYFSGGANSVRGWSVRELGPGSFQGSDGRIDFINQTGDIKLDLNAEYRTHLFWKLDGAAFLDAGNIWTIRHYDEQPGGQFKFDEFWRQIAVSYGLGIRLNFNYFILRFDGGMKAIHPAFRGREHYPVIHPNLKRDFTFHFAVGMPF